jgi:hypothetical protein
MHSLRNYLAILGAVVSIEVVQSAHSAQDVVPLYTPALEEQLQPPCCRHAPFTATYRQGRQTLVFVAVRHVFSTANPTIRAVDSGFAAISPAMVIVEGFPTGLGENPSSVVEVARKHGTPEADEYARSDMMYTVSIAVSRGIPFLGGEPTPKKELQALGRGGYTANDIAFAELVEGLGQTVRAGNLTAGARDSRLAPAFSHSAEAFMIRFSLKPMSFEGFSARYKLMFGVGVAEDEKLAARTWPGTDSQLALFKQAEMNVRDRHLLATVEQELALKERVLVVYGGGHWITLSQALQRRLGKPTIVGFAD